MTSSLLSMNQNMTFKFHSMYNRHDWLLVRARYEQIKIIVSFLFFPFFFLYFFGIGEYRIERHYFRDKPSLMYVIF